VLCYVRCYEFFMGHIAGVIGVAPTFLPFLSLIAVGKCSEPHYARFQVWRCTAGLLFFR